LQNRKTNNSNGAAAINPFGTKTMKNQKKTFESLTDSKFSKLEESSLAKIVGGFGATEMDSFTTTASNPNEGDGVSCDSDPQQ
jgi:hypothetical protein